MCPAEKGKEFDIPYLGKIVKTRNVEIFEKYLPTQIEEITAQEKDLATIHVRLKDFNPRGAQM